MADEPVTNDNQNPSADQQWITTKEAAEIVDVSVQHIRYLIKQGKIQAQKFGQHAWMVDKESALEYALSERKPGPKSQG